MRIGLWYSQLDHRSTGWPRWPRQANSTDRKITASGDTLDSTDSDDPIGSISANFQLRNNSRHFAEISQMIRSQWHSRPTWRRWSKEKNDPSENMALIFSTGSPFHWVTQVTQTGKQHRQENYWIRWHTWLRWRWHRWSYWVNFIKFSAKMMLFASHTSLWLFFSFPKSITRQKSITFFSPLNYLTFFLLLNGQENQKEKSNNVLF